MARAAAATASKPKVAKKAKKDPNAPKRGVSAFIIFSNAKRESVKADLMSKKGSAEFKEIGKILGAQWQSMDASARKEYDEQAAADKKRYEAEKEAYMAKKDAEEEADLDATAAKKKSKSAKAAPPPQSDAEEDDSE